MGNFISWEEVIDELDLRTQVGGDHVLQLSRPTLKQVELELYFGTISGMQLYLDVMNIDDDDDDVPLLITQHMV